MPTDLDAETSAVPPVDPSPAQVPAEGPTDVVTAEEGAVDTVDTVDAGDGADADAEADAPDEAVPDTPAVPSEPDAVCAAAIDLAREGAVDVSGDAAVVGDHLGLDAEGDRVVTHYFACLSKGYRGWRWAVTVARAPRLRTATVSEVVLLPGAEAVLAPTWLPWSDRLAPGDLGPADQLPYRAEDPYLEPGYQQTDDADADEVALWELGLGRVRVLSPLGRAAAAERWYLGDRGPTSDEAVHAAAACASCGYFVALAGSLRQVFGVCANEWSPSDGRVVSVDHGCGAHSETDVERPEPLPLPEPILDETGAEAVVLPPRAAAKQPDGDEPTAVPTEDAAPVEDAAAVEDVALADEAPLDDEREAVAVALLEVVEEEAKAQVEAAEPAAIEEPAAVVESAEEPTEEPTEEPAAVEELVEESGEPTAP